MCSLSAFASTPDTSTARLKLYFQPQIARMKLNSDLVLAPVLDLGFIYKRTQIGIVSYKLATHSGPLWAGTDSSDGNRLFVIGLRFTGIFNPESRLEFSTSTLFGMGEASFSSETSTDYIYRRRRKIWNDQSIYIIEPGMGITWRHLPWLSASLSASYRATFSLEWWESHYFDELSGLTWFLGLRVTTL